MSVQRFVDKAKSLEKLLSQQTCEIFDQYSNAERLTQDDLKYLLNEIEFDNDYAIFWLSENISLLKYVVDNELFQELVDKFKSVQDERSNPCLYKVLENEELLEESIQNNRLTKDDTRYLLNKIDKYYELYELCNNTPLIKYILNKFMLDKELVDRLNTIAEKNDWCKDFGIHTIFELIKYLHKNNEEILKLNEVNKKMHSFALTQSQKLELIELIQTNEIAKNRLIQIVDNHLESQFDFESLMSYLKKSEKKSILNI